MIVAGSPLFHRGPDRHCLWQEGNAASCRRLSNELTDFFSGIAHLSGRFVSLKTKLLSPFSTPGL